MMRMLKRLVRPLVGPILPTVNQLRTANKLVYVRDAYHQHIMAMIEQGELVKLVIGSTGTAFEGWVMTDLPYLDATNERHWELILRGEKVDRILAEHVFEHLTIDQFKQFLWVVRNHLSGGAYIRIAVPDGNHPDPAYIEHVRPGGIGAGADDHKVLYTAKLMSEVLESEGYSYRLLEYFDAQGDFHRVDWDDADGYVYRSAEHDSRNKDAPLTYTSLIVDLWIE